MSLSENGSSSPNKSGFRTNAVRRILPMTPRVRTALENRWTGGGKPETGFVWPGQTGTGYIHDETLQRAHLKTVQATKMCHFPQHPAHIPNQVGRKWLRRLDLGTNCRSRFD